MKKFLIVLSLLTSCQNFKSSQDLATKTFEQIDQDVYRYELGPQLPPVAPIQ